jgi:hypothetical protein
MPGGDARRRGHAPGDDACSSRASSSATSSPRSRTASFVARPRT